MFHRLTMRTGVLICAIVLGTACGPRAHIPARLAHPELLPGALTNSDPGARLARALAPVLFVQRDEYFPLDRIVAVVHPTRPVIAYHLLWRDDVHGSWIPSTVPTDEEIVWVGYDSTGAPTDLWTFWHGTVLHTPWKDKGGVIVNVQWGKHGLMPRGLIESDLPRMKKLNDFFAYTRILEWDILLGDLTRPGPTCFCYGYDRYREFTKPLVTSDHIDVVTRTADATPILATVFGWPYSRKRPWP